MLSCSVELKAHSVRDLMKICEAINTLGFAHSVALKNPSVVNADTGVTMYNSSLHVDTHRTAFLNPELDQFHCYRWNGPFKTDGPPDFSITMRIDPSLG